METVYTQKHDHLTLSLHWTLNENGYNFQTILTGNRSKKNLVLDSVQIESSEYNYRRLYKIIFSYLDDKDLYILCDKFGAIQLVHYHFTASNEFEKTEHLIGAYLSGLGSGHTNAKFNHIKIKNTLYFYLHAGMPLISDQKGLFSLDLSTSQLKRVNFEDQYRVVTAVYVEQSTKDSYENVAYRFLTKEDIDEINETKKYYAQPYYLLEVNKEEKEREKELSKYKKISLSVYPTFEKTREEVEKEEEKGIDSSWNRDLYKPKERKRAEKFIKEILSFTGNKMAEKYKMQNFLYEGYNNYPEYVEMYYFFCLDERNQVQIIRYDMYNNLWYIGNFEETDFEPQIDIYKSPDSEL